MVVGINSNLAASSATANLNKANDVVSGSISRLSSGNRIISASDDAAGLAIGTSLSTTVTSLEIALLNTEQARSVLQIADGALSELNDILARQKALATQSNSGSISDTERGYINQEFTALTSEIDRIVDNTNFNGISLLDGSLGSSDGLGLAETIGYSATDVGSTEVAGGTVTFGGTDDNAIVGSLADIDISATSVAADSVTCTAVIGSAIFQGANTDIAASQTITLTNAESGQTISFDLSTGAAADQTALDTIASAVQTDLREGTVFQERTLATDSTGVTATAADGTILEGLSGANFEISSSSVSGTTAPVLGSFSVTAETGTTDGSVSVTLDGASYSTVAGEFDGDGTDIQLDTLDGGTGTVRLFLDGDSANGNSYIDIDLATNVEASGIDLDTAGKAQALETALNSAVGVGNNGALSFQVGSSVSDKIDISISSAQTSDLYVNDAGTSTTISVDTQENAQTAIDVLDNAIANVVSKRADIGASISRFDFAASNIETSIANQDNARGSFLDADIANESTSFATAQVKLQASVSVLAQANQLPQNLLQLLQ